MRRDTKIHFHPECHGFQSISSQQHLGDLNFNHIPYHPLISGTLITRDIIDSTYDVWEMKEFPYKNKNFCTACLRYTEKALKKMKEGFFDEPKKKIKDRLVVLTLHVPSS